MGAVMGNAPSWATRFDELLKREKLTWVENHSLMRSCELRNRFLPSLREHFRSGSSAKLLYREEPDCCVSYKHFYITCGMWSLEFGGGALLDNKVEIHNRCLPLGGVEEKTFTIDARHIQRMENVVGATGYSLCLRNCEHVARYICYGSWQSLQMMAEHPLYAKLAIYMQDHAKTKMNTPPIELVDSQRVMRPLYPDEDGFVEVMNESKHGLTVNDEAAYNVVFIGPTGSGKSSLINHLCNRTICHSGASAMSVTRQISVYEGRAMIHGRQKKVNLIDTIGLCDSTMSENDVLELIKQWLTVQRASVDRFVFCVSGRIEAVHAQCIKKILKWLFFNTNPFRFVFVYNKVDQITDFDEVEANVQIMREMLQTRLEGTDTSHLNLPLGIPPDASFINAKERLTPFLKAVFPSELDHSNRVTVHDYQCFLL